MISRNGGTNPHWSRNGREIFYLSAGGMMTAAIRPGATLAFDPPKELFRTSAMAFDAAPDGQRFLALLPPGGDTEHPLTVVLNWQKALLK
jgi:hypothetical protein